MNTAAHSAARTWRYARAVFMVLPSASLRDLVRKHRERFCPGCNYIIQWKDAHGYGIELARADWPADGTVYTNL